MSRALPVHEQFFTWQGEGCHMGRAAYFIRLFGCPVHCPWCDSAGTWHPDFIPQNIDRIPPEALVENAVSHNPDFVVITGGEPAIHDLKALTAAFHEQSLPVHLETSGAFPIHGQFDWITLSPKRWKKPLAANIELASEFKIIVDQPGAIDEWATIYGTSFGKRSVWLHPEWSQRDDVRLLDSITAWVKGHGFPYRAGWQLHKNFAVDRLDPGSRPPIPLGGNPNLGF